MKKWISISMFLLLAGVLTACGSDELEHTLGFETTAIEGTTQEGEPFSLEAMEGKVWLADFIFTSCNTVCPPMTRNMVKIQEMLEKEGVEAEIVSFSVDPTVDTPEKLKAFSEKYGVELDNWTFVTGYSQEEIETFAKESFKALVAKPEGVEQVTHGTSFYLVGPEGMVLKKYSGAQDVPFEQIVEDVKTVTK